MEHNLQDRAGRFGKDPLKNTILDPLHCWWWRRRAGSAIDSQPQHPASPPAPGGGGSSKGQPSLTHPRVAGGQHAAAEAAGVAMAPAGDNGGAAVQQGQVVGQGGHHQRADGGLLPRLRGRGRGGVGEPRKGEAREPQPIPTTWAKERTCCCFWALLHCPGSPTWKTWAGWKTALAGPSYGGRRHYCKVPENPLKFLEICLKTLGQNALKMHNFLLVEFPLTEEK